MSMPLDEMKLAVCEKLPELIYMQKCGWWYWRPQTLVNPKVMRSLINWPTEGLQVCHEAEKLLNDKQWATYTAFFDSIAATYEQRLEALCRVWFSERFTGRQI